jgi:hypothetical protein
VPETTIATYIHEALDVHSYLTAKVTFNLVVVFKFRAQLLLFLFSQVFHPCVGVDASCCDYLLRNCRTYSEDVGKGYFDPLFTRQVDAGYTSHPATSLLPGAAYDADFCCRSRERRHGV